jgi:VanZ family protein
MLISDPRLTFDIRGVSLRNFLRACAISLGAAVLIFTVVPAAERPYTGMQHDLEHISAFLLLGVLLGIAFRIRAPLLLLVGSIFTLAMECIQIPLPTRHARLADFGFDTAAICVGILIARLPWSRVNSWWNRPQESG